MFRVLLWKEWRQLRLLRWAGCGIGLLMPGLLLALAELGRRGWLFDSIASYSPATVVQEALPAVLALAVWPVLALMTAAQAFTSDRAEGTEAFLLERPVRRSLVWRARGTATFGTVGAIMASHVLIWWLAVRVLGHPAAFDESAALGLFLLQGGPATAVALLAGLAAAAFARSPVQAVLLGAVLGAIPVSVSALFAGGLFWGYRLGDYPVGVAIPLLLLAGYVVSSFRMECRGEPAGRGRVRRGLAVLVAAFVAMPVFVAASAPIIMRWDARLGLGNTTVIAAPNGTAALVVNNHQRAAWLIDTSSGDTLRFFPTPVYNGCWTDDGSRLAVLRGSPLRDPRIELFDRSGSRLGDPVVCEACRQWWNDSMTWVDGHVVLGGFMHGRDVVVIVDPQSGRTRVAELPEPVRSWRLLEPGAGGAFQILRVFRSRAVDGTGEADRSRLDGELHRLDIAAASLGPGRAIADMGSAYHAASSLSPSGQAWLRFPLMRGEPYRILNLDSGEVTELPAKRAVWLDGDQLAWIEQPRRGSVELAIGDPGEPRRRDTLEADWVWLTPSPHGKRLLITGASSHEPGVFRRWIYDSETDRLEPFDAELGENADGIGAVQWATRDTFAFVAPGSLSLSDPETGKTTAVIGRR